MGLNGRALRQHVAPPHHLAVRDRNELRNAPSDIVHDERARAVERRRFEKREILPLARNGIERSVKAFYVFGGNRGDRDGHHGRPEPGGAVWSLRTGDPFTVSGNLFAQTRFLPRGESCLVSRHIPTRSPPTLPISNDACARSSTAWNAPAAARHRAPRRPPMICATASPPVCPAWSSGSATVPSTRKRRG